MNHAAKKSILLQLILAIAGASIISAMVASLGQYLFSSSLITDSAKSQSLSALQLSKALIENEYTRLFTHDLTLIKSNEELVNLTTSDKINRSQQYIKAQDISRNFININRGIYEGIYLLNSNKDFLLSVENNEGLFSNSNNEQEIDNKRLVIFEVFNQFKQSNKTGNLFFGPILGESNRHFLVATRIDNIARDKNLSLIHI